MPTNIVNNISEMDLYHNIKAARDEKGLSQAEMARRLELDPSAYHRLEHRGNKLSVEQVNGIANAIGISLIELLIGGQEVRSESNDSKQQASLIESLNKKVLELEDRLKDKQFINTKLAAERDYVVDLIKSCMEDLKGQVYEDLETGSVTYEDEDGNQQSMPFKAFLELSREDGQRIENSPEFEVTTSEAEDKKVIEAMFTDKKYLLVTAFLMNTGYFQDKELLEAYEEHFDEMYRWMRVNNEKRLTQNLNPGLSKILRRKRPYYYYM